MISTAVISLGPKSLQTIEGKTFLTSTSRQDCTRFTITDPSLIEWASGLKFIETYRASVESTALSQRIVSVTPCLAAAVSRDAPPTLLSENCFTPSDELSDTLQQVRAYLEAIVWPELLETLGENPYPPGTAPSAGLCRLSAPIVRDLLLQAFPDGGWSVEGGHPSIAYGDQMKSDLSRRWDGLDGGLWDANRQVWDGHFWVTGLDGRERVIADLTGDQYGWNEVTVARSDDPRYRANMLPSVVRKETSSKRFLAMIDGYAERFPLEERTIKPPAPALSSA